MEVKRRMHSSRNKLQALSASDGLDNPSSLRRSVASSASVASSLRRSVASSRRATVLIFVVALLGILFIAGAAFISTVNFEAKTQDALDDAATGETVADLGPVIDFLDKSWLGTGAKPYAIADSTVLETGTYPGSTITTPQYGEIGGLSPLLSAIEPYRIGQGGGLPGANNDVMNYDYGTQASTLTTGQVYSSVPPTLDPVSGVNGSDADADGIADTLAAIPITTPGFFTQEEIDYLQGTLNLPGSTSTPTLALRVIPHGGMVNVNTGHPLLINTVLHDHDGVDSDGDGLDADLDDADGDGTLDIFDESSIFTEWPYNEVANEERLLRHRWMLPPDDIDEMNSALHGTDITDNPGDLMDYLFPATGDAAFPSGENLDDYRWWPYQFDSNGDANVAEDVWFKRLDAAAGSTDYDVRHLLTTISEDDLFIRGMTVPKTVDTTGDGIPDIADMNGDGVQGAGEDGDLVDSILIFEPVYPSVTPIGGYSCSDVDLWRMVDPGSAPAPNNWAIDGYPLCVDRDDLRKGRMQISLGYVEQTLLNIDGAGPLVDGIDAISNYYESAKASASFLAMFNQERRALAAVRLIQDGFLIMLSNKLGGTTGSDSGQILRGSGGPQLDYALTAASLTANLIDFADTDGVPTAVPVRSLAGVPDGRVAYGLEAQPYITELYAWATLDSNGDFDPSNGNGSAEVVAVEIYNPYTANINLAEYSVVDAETGIGYPLAGTNATLGPGKTRVISNFTTGNGPVNPLDPANSDVFDASITFGDGGVELHRTFTPTGGLSTRIIVDAFSFAGFSDPSLGVSFSTFKGYKNYSTPNATFNGGSPPESLQRDTNITYAGTGGRWKLTVPESSQETQSITPTSKRLISAFASSAVPVQADFANTGALTDIDLNNDGDTLDAGEIPGSFPTTASMLLLMRHANRSTADPVATERVPFTKWLFDTATVPLNPVGDESRQIDNGRMPVFDVAGNYRWVEGNEPRDTAPPTGLKDNNQVDGLNALPWGQYVFDYFTALPLDQPNSGVFNPLPVVSQSGMRVSGRVNINAAPWSVLAGMPLIPSSSVPAAFRTQVTETVGLNATYPVPIGPALAQSIVAYREARHMPVGSPIPQPNISGDYAAFDDTIGPTPGVLDPGEYIYRSRDPGYRSITPPLGSSAGSDMRRGTGFLTVGELLEVRHPGSQVNIAVTHSQYAAPELQGNALTRWRMDSGVVGRCTDANFNNNGTLPPIYADDTCNAIDAEDYVSAIAQMVALGDWATTKGHVFTIYATIKGDGPVGSNTLRIQQTVNRLDGLLDNLGPKNVYTRIVEQE